MALRYYRGGQAHNKGESLFGSPRGNAVMKAKRVTGESARTILLRHMTLERCGKCGQQRVLYTKNSTGIDKERVCADCLTQGEPTAKSLKELLAMPTRYGG